MTKRRLRDFQGKANEIVSPMGAKPAAVDRSLAVGGRVQVRVAARIRVCPEYVPLGGTEASLGWLRDWGDWA